MVSKNRTQKQKESHYFRSLIIIDFKENIFRQLFFQPSNLQQSVHRLLEIFYFPKYFINRQNYFLKNTCQTAR
jgi:hypothetical protein